MEDSELSVSKEGTPAAAQHDNQRNLVHRLQPEGSELHLVAERPKSSCWCISSSEATFNLNLKAMFIILLAVTVITVLMTENSNTRYSPFPDTWYRPYEPPQLKWTGFLFVASFVSVFTAGVLMRNIRTKTSSRPSGKEEMSTISAVVKV